MANSRILALLVRSLLPEIPALNPVERVEIEEEVARFVETQIAAMPGFLRLPYRLALHLFNCSALLRYGRAYESLDATRRQAYVRAWAESGIAPMRDFVKLARSCTLLQYLDHPRVAARLEEQSDGGSIGG